MVAIRVHLNVRGGVYGWCIWISADQRYECVRPNVIRYERVSNLRKTRYVTLEFTLSNICQQVFLLKDSGPP